jgi:hypothetical protein
MFFDVGIAGQNIPPGCQFFIVGQSLRNDCFAACDLV